ncbi:MAG: hypothetical protein ACMXYF_04100 [Candidatus Woesearchaeota archaeon]
MSFTSWSLHNKYGIWMKPTNEFASIIKQTGNQPSHDFYFFSSKKRITHPRYLEKMQRLLFMCDKNCIFYATDTFSVKRTLLGKKEITHVYVGISPGNFNQKLDYSFDNRTAPGIGLKGASLCVLVFEITQSEEFKKALEKHKNELISSTTFLNIQNKPFEGITFNPGIVFSVDVNKYSFEYIDNLDKP